MTTKSPTKPATPRLSDVARHVVAPRGVVATGWPAVVAKAADLGVTFDPWQHGAGKLILAKRADGKYAAVVGGTAMSIPRQVGKTYLVGAIVFALCLLHPGLTVIWTAHRLRTAAETFDKMRGFAERGKVKPHVAKVILANGEEEVRFANGSRILFGARERGFGRGFDEVDVLIFDEAQILTENAIDDMLPATNQSRQKAGALVLYMGTPPKPTDPGEVFTRIRTEVLSGEDEDTGYVEFSGDPDFAPTPTPAPMDAQDWAQIAKANPSYPDRTPREAILRMRKRLSPDSMLREGYGIWDDPERQGRGAINFAQWVSLRNDDAPEPSRAVLVIEVDQDRRTASVAVAADGSPGKTLVLVDHRPGTDWVVPRVQHLRETRDVVEVALRPASQAGTLVPQLVSAGIDFEALTGMHHAGACGAFQEAAKGSVLEHVGQASLDAAVKNARTRTRGEGEVWTPRDPTIPISPVVAASEAAYRFGISGGESIYEQRGLVILGGED